MRLDQRDELTLDLAERLLLLGRHRLEAGPGAVDLLTVGGGLVAGLLRGGLLLVELQLRRRQRLEQRVVLGGLGRGVLLGDQEPLRVGEVETLELLAREGALVGGHRPLPHQPPDPGQVTLRGYQVGLGGGEGLLGLLEADLGSVGLLAERVDLLVVGRDLRLEGLGLGLVVADLVGPRGLEATEGEAPAGHRGDEEDGAKAAGVARHESCRLMGCPQRGNRATGSGSISAFQRHRWSGTGARGRQGKPTEVGGGGSSGWRS